MLGMPRPTLCQVLSKPEGKHQQHTHCPGRRNNWRCGQRDAQDKCSLENRRMDHQTSMVEVQGMIQNFSVSILLDLGSSLSYISPSIVEKCKLPLKKIDKSWLVKLATRTK